MKYKDSTIGTAKDQQRIGLLEYRVEKGRVDSRSTSIVAMIR
jgi:hypothetical protein